MSEDLKLPELAAALDKLLRPMTPKADRTKDFLWGRRQWWGAQYVGGRYVEVRTGWPHNLTKVEAAHFLWGLENGYTGTWEDFEKENPVPVAEFYRVDLVKLSKHGRFQLYGVRRETAQRLYGAVVVEDSDGYTWSPEHVDKARVVKEDATEEDLAAFNEAWEDYTDMTRAASQTYQKKLAELKGGTKS